MPMLSTSHDAQASIQDFAYNVLGFHFSLYETVYGKPYSPKNKKDIHQIPSYYVYENRSIRIEIYYNFSEVYLHLIEAKEKLQGHATAIMHQICAAADIMNIQLALCCEPQDLQEEGGISKRKLAQFYRAFNFKGPTGEMVRKPVPL